MAKLLDVLAKLGKVEPHHVPFASCMAETHVCSLSFSFHHSHTFVCCVLLGQRHSLSAAAWHTLLHIERLASARLIALPHALALGLVCIVNLVCCV